MRWALSSKDTISAALRDTRETNLGVPGKYHRDLSEDWKERRNLQKKKRGETEKRDSSIHHSVIETESIYD